MAVSFHASTTQARADSITTPVGDVDPKLEPNRYTREPPLGSSRPFEVTAANVGGWYDHRTDAAALRWLTAMTMETPTPTPAGVVQLMVRPFHECAGYINGTHMHKWHYNAAQRVKRSM